MPATATSYQTTVETRTDGLTRDDIKALKSANSWVLYAEAQVDSKIPGILSTIRPGTLRAVLEKDDDVWGRSTLYRDLAVDATIIDYASEHQLERVIDRASYYVWSREIFRSIASVLKVGDKIELRFHCQNNSPQMDKAGIVNDEAYVIIHRYGKSGMQTDTLTFMVGHQPSTPGSQRMCTVFRNW